MIAPTHAFILVTETAVLNDLIGFDAAALSRPLRVHYSLPMAKPQSVRPGGDGGEVVPDKIFKFRSLAPSDREFARQLVVEGKLWFASPLTFNDPFDTLPVISTEATPAERRHYYRRIIRNNLPGLTRAERLRQAKELDFHHETSNKGFLVEALQQTAAKIAICSFASAADSMLLWSHYADQHAGICVRINTLSQFFQRSLPLRVRYSHERAIYSPLRRERPEVLIDKLLTKADCWDYEREWRMFEQVQGLREMPRGSVEAVYLGCRISAENREEVLAWVAGMSDPPEVYEGSPSESTFAIEFTRIV